VADEKPLVVIRRAEPNDARDLTALMKASAAYSGAYASILADYAVSPNRLGATTCSSP